MYRAIINFKTFRSTYKVENIPFLFQCTIFRMEPSKPDYCTFFGKIHGILMYKDFMKYWDDVETFQARPDDIVIATYPKSGKFLYYVNVVLIYKLQTHLEW